MALDAILALLTGRSSSVEGEDHPKPAWASRHAKAWTIVVKRLVAATANSLQTVNVSPGNAPRSEVLAEIIGSLFKRENLEPWIFVITRDNTCRDTARRRYRLIDPGLP